jgi:tRNA (guanine-N7-)-methyltransferase
MGRLRKDPNALTILKKSKIVIKKPSKKYFNNKNDLCIEIGMGKGNFIINKAIKNPKTNFIGIDLFPTVIMKAIKKYDSLKDKPKNLKLLSCDASKLLEYFKQKTISTIFLNFSDPWPKAKHEKRRLTSENFLKLYYTLLKDEGTIEFKTDNDKLFSYSLESIPNSKIFNIIYFTKDLYSDKQQLVNNIQTEYEQKFVSINKNINKLISKKII